MPSARGDLVACCIAAPVVDEQYRDGMARITALATPKMAAQIQPAASRGGCSISPTS